MTDTAEVLVLCKKSRQVADDLYVNGQQYKIAAERAAKYGDYFTVLTVTTGDEYDEYKVPQLREIVEEAGIEIGARATRAELLAVIRLRNAESGAPTGDPDGQGSNFSPGLTTKSGKSSGSGSKGSDSEKSDPKE